MLNPFDYHYFSNILILKYIPTTFKKLNPEYELYKKILIIEDYYTITNKKLFNFEYKILMFVIRIKLILKELKDREKTLKQSI